MLYNISGYSGSSQAAVLLGFLFRGVEVRDLREVAQDVLRRRVHQALAIYIYIYIYYVYICMCVYLYIYIYIQTRHNVRLPTPPILLSFIFSFSLRGGLTQRVGSYVGFIRRVLPGVDPWRYPVAKCACSAGPDPGSLSSRSRVHTRSRAKFVRSAGPDRGSYSKLWK